MREIGVGIIGLGNVGAGALRLLSSHAKDIESRLGARVAVRRIGVRDLGKARPVAVAPNLLTTDLNALVDDPSIAIVVELMGGIEPAKSCLLRALSKGKHVVTANKAVLALHGEEIFAAARAQKLDVYYEAAVCGGIPIIRTLREALASDRVDAIAGIVNGTTNYILGRMAEAKISFEQALREAQQAGYAEADPSLDIHGGDAAQKLCLLAGLAFNTWLAPGQVHTEGIAALEPVDLEAAREFGYVVKLLAVARREGERLQARVHPVMIPAHSLLADVRGAFNAVLLQSEALGTSLLYGQGAGGLPTATAVVSDVIDLCRNIVADSPGRVPLPGPGGGLALRPMEELVCSYYLRFSVDDEPGVLARIAGVLAEQSISISAVVQRERRGKGQGPVAVLILTHDALERDVRTAVGYIDSLPSNRAPTRLIRIEKQPPLGAEGAQSPASE